MHRIIHQLANFLFPPLCVHCRREGTWLCLTAREEIANIPVLVDPVQIDGVDRVVCRGDYDLPLLGNIIQRVKYDFWTAPADYVFPKLLKKLTPLLQLSSSDTVIVPIPLHWRRRLSRGFNQSELITRALHEITGHPVTHLIQRRRFTTPQAKLSGQERVTNVAGAFRVQSGIKVPIRVILVDDVITTGSTIRECAEVLRAAGVQKITAVALAKG